MLNRFNGHVVPFADNATATNRTVFGDPAQSDDIDDNLNADFKIGWEIVGINDNPTKQDFNALAYTLGNLISYLYQEGMPKWNAIQKFYVNSYCIGSDGEMYKALTGTEPSPNRGNNPTSDAINWQGITKNKFVDLLTAQTIAGVKTFSDNLIIAGTSGKGLFLRPGFETTKQPSITLTGLDDLNMNSWDLMKFNLNDVLKFSLSNTLASFKIPLTTTSQLRSSVATGTPPLTVASTTKVTNLNADQLDGLDSTDFVNRTAAQTIAGIKTFGSFPVTPSSAPTLDYQVANKKYVNDNSGISLSTANSYDFGVDQTWQDLFASRSSGVTYTNSTGKPIMIVFEGLGSTDTNRVRITINGTLVIEASNNGVVGEWVSAIIPDGDTYVAIGPNAIMSWWELR